MKTWDWFRRQRMLIQLYISFGTTVVLVSGIFIGLWAIAVYSLRDTLLDKSVEYLRNQVAEIGERIAAEAKEVFEAKVQVGAQSFLFPISILLFDTYDTTRTFSVKPVPSFFANQLSNLKPAPGEDTLQFDPDRLLCNPPDPCRQETDGGCQCSGTKRYSSEASSVFHTGMTPTRDPGEVLRYQQDQVDKSSHMDTVIKDVWAANPTWIQCYLGMPAPDIEGVSIYRNYPGTVFENLEDNNVNSYDPTERPWYTAAATASHGTPKTRASQLSPPPLSITAPYEDADGKGYLISLASPVRAPDGSLVGVIALDLFVDALRHAIVAIKARETGEAFLHHIESGRVLASKQLLLAGVTGDLPQLDSLSLLTARDKTFADLDGTATPCHDGQKGSATQHDVMLVWTPVWEKQFCLTVVTPMDEIDAPIALQLEDIKAGADSLFTTPLVLVLICGSVLFVLVLIIAHDISGPLNKTARETREIAESIGGEASVDSDSSGKGAWRVVCGEVGEVSELRARFEVLLDDLLTKREKPQPPPNPLKNKIIGDRLVCSDGQPGVPLPVGSAEPQEALPLPAGPKVDMQSIQVHQDPNHVREWRSRITQLNKMRTHLALKVILPLVVVFIVIVATSSVRMRSKATEWAKPVQDQLIKEELQSLDQRVRERARFVTEYLTKDHNSLLMIKDYWEQLLDGELTEEQPNPSYMSPSKRCNKGLGPKLSEYADMQFNDRVCLEPPLVDEIDHSGSDFLPETTNRRISVEAMGIFVPDYKIEEDPANDNYPTKKPFGDGVLVGSKNDEMKLMSHLDNVFRAAFMSSSVTDIYLGTHNTETMWWYPYQRFDSLTSTTICDSVMRYDLMDPPSAYRNLRSSTFNPVCRPWYQRGTRAPKNKVVYNPVDFDASYAEPTPYLALSTPVYKSGEGGGLVGVAALSVKLSDLYSSLQRTPLYEKGYAFVWDENLLAVVHKGVKQGLEDWSIRWVDATAGGEYELDENWYAAQKTGIFDKGRVEGTWAFEWHNSATGKMEWWHYTFVPIDNTPYMLALSVAQVDITKEADEMLDKLKSKVSFAAGITSGLLILACVFLGFFTFWFNKQVAQHIGKLADYVGTLQISGYTEDVPLDKKVVASAEMIEICENIQRMLMALRFSNPAYTKGDPIKEMRSCVDALTMITQLGKPEAYGICFNNMGNCARSIKLDPRLKSQCQSTCGTFSYNGESCSCTNTDYLFQGAVDAVRQDPTKADTMAARLLNWSTCKAADGKVVEAARLMRQSTETTDSADMLATLAIGFARTQPRSLKETTIQEALDGMCEKAIAKLVDSLERDPSTVAKVCAMLCILDSPDSQEEWEGASAAEAAASTGRGATGVRKWKRVATAWWALRNIHQMSHPVLRVLTACALQGAPEEVREEVKRGVPNLEDVCHGMVLDGDAIGALLMEQPCQLQQAKTVVLCLDVSGSMRVPCRTPTGGSSSRLNMCKESMRTVINTVMNEGDALGLYTFNQELQMRVECQSFNDALREQTARQIRGITSGGGTAFWPALMETLTVASKTARDSKWVVALTDGEDGSGTTEEGVCRLMRTTTVNLIVITVASTHCVPALAKIKTAAESNRNKLIHIEAGNDDIAEAFGKVQSILAGGGISENL